MGSKVAKVLVMVAVLLVAAAAVAAHPSSPL
jgi:hypothetical protein